MPTTTIAQPTRLQRTLNLDEAAEFLGIHKQTLRRKAMLGEIPGAKPGKAWRFIEEDLVNHLRSLYAQSRQVPQGAILEKSKCHSIKRGKVWWVRFTDPNGKEIRRSAQTVVKKDAQEFHDRLKAEYWRIKHLGDRPRRTWEEAVVQWLHDKKHKKDYRNDVAKLKWLSSYLRGAYLDEIDWEVIDNVARAKDEEGAAPATVNRYLALIKSVLRRAKKKWKWIDDVPDTPMRDEGDPPIHFLTREEAERLIRELPSHLAEMARFAVATGLRAGNVVKIKWAQVDMQRQLAWINPDEAKAGKAIGVPLNTEAMAVLQRQRGRHAEFVFTYRGRPIGRCSTSAWYRALKRVGFAKTFRWHDWRHTWASWHAQNGTPQSVLQTLGGWSSPEMVRRYSHLSTEHLAAWVENSAIYRTDPGTANLEEEEEIA